MANKGKYYESQFEEATMVPVSANVVADAAKSSISDE